MSDRKEISIREKEQINKETGEPTRSNVYYSPTVDIFESKEATTLLADIPGVEQRDLHVDINDGQLTITGLVNSPEPRFESVYTEYGIGGYQRKFQLNDTIDQAKITAALKDGVLTLVLPKADRVKPRKIEVTV